MREKILWEFTTYPITQSSYTINWVSDSKLKQNITKLMESKPEFKKYEIEDWVRFLISEILNDEQKTSPQDKRLKLGHLQAYLYKIGIKAGERVYQQLFKYKNIQLHYQRIDIYQIGFCYASDPQDFFRSFKGFNNSNKSNPVENYAFKRIGLWTKKVC